MYSVFILPLAFSRLLLLYKTVRFFMFAGVQQYISVFGLEMYNIYCNGVDLISILGHMSSILHNLGRRCTENVKIMKNLFFYLIKIVPCYNAIQYFKMSQISLH